MHDFSDTEDRYRVVRTIGSGAQGHTQLAVDNTTDEYVALKEIDFEGISSWDAVATFERECAVLGGLDHAAIPRFVESFRKEDEDSTRMFLVQTFVEGDNLGSVFVRLGYVNANNARWLRNEIHRYLLECRLDGVPALPQQQLEEVGPSNAEVADASGPQSNSPK